MGATVKAARRIMNAWLARVGPQRVARADGADAVDPAALGPDGSPWLSRVDGVWMLAIESSWNRVRCGSPLLGSADGIEGGVGR